MALDYANPADAAVDSAGYRRGLFVVAFALVASVFPLIWMGGLVTSYGAGLSVPDWPNSYGYNMFLFPPSQWLGGIFYEHTHRLLGTLSGFLSIGLMLMAWGPARTTGGRRGWTIAAIGLWVLTVVASGLAVRATYVYSLGDSVLIVRPDFAVGFASLALPTTVAVFCRQREPRRWVRWLTVGVFAAVCIQGLLGGYRVKLAESNLAIIHGCFAQFFLCLAGFTALVTSRWWQSTDSRSRLSDANAGRTALTLAIVMTCVIYGQLIAGALMRHNGAGLAIPGVGVYGHWLPPTDPAALDAINAQRVWTDHLPPLSSLTQVWLHFAHRVGAVLVTICVLTWAGYVFQKLGRRTPSGRAAGRVAAILVGLLSTQVTLGVLTVYLRKPADVASLHVAVGALTLLTASLAAAVLARQYARGPVRATENAPAGRLVTV